MKSVKLKCKCGHIITLLMESMSEVLMVYLKVKCHACGHEGLYGTHIEGWHREGE